MKQQILALSFVITLFYSCSSDSESAPEAIKGEVKVDYRVDTGVIEDFVVNTDNTVYYTGQLNSASQNLMVFNKIDLDGKKSSLLNLDKSIFFNNRLSYNSAGQVLMFTFDNAHSDELFRFENNFSEVKSFYTVKPDINAASIGAIAKNDDDTYFIFDYGNMAIRKIAPGINVAIPVAGSGLKEVKDGFNTEAGFSDIYLMAAKNNVLYVVDGLAIEGKQNNIRKVELLDAGWKVSTLISTTTDIYSSIAVDSNGDLFVLVQKKGIYKLNQQNSTLSLYKGGELKVQIGKDHSTLNLNDADKMKIKGNDLYLTGNMFAFTKISDFQAKFLEAGK